MCLLTNQKKERDLTGTRVWKILYFDGSGDLRTPWFDMLVYARKLVPNGEKEVKSGTHYYLVNGGYIHAYTCAEHANHVAIIVGGVPVPGIARGKGFLDEGTSHIAVEEIELDYIPTDGIE